MLDKKDVEYEHPAKGAHHCSECRHYHADETCEIVAGRVLPRDWCKEFKAKSSRARRLKALLLEMRLLSVDGHVRVITTDARPFRAYAKGERYGPKHAEPRVDG